jgi:diguanylate cyclase (GGDEF)-like protein
MRLSISMVRSKMSLDRKSALPGEVHAALVESLFGTIGSFVAGILGGLLVPTIAWARTHDPIFLGCALVMLALSVFRLWVFESHSRSEPAQRKADAGHWERLYAWGGISFMLAVGITASILFFRVHDELTSLYGVVITLGCAGALAGRNAGRPYVVYGQMLGVCCPLAIAFLVHGDGWYIGLSAIFGLIMISTKSTTNFLNHILVSALVMGREARIQRSQFSTALDSMSHGLCMGENDGSIVVLNRRLREFFDIEETSNRMNARQLANQIASYGRMSNRRRTGFVDTWEQHVAKRDSSVFSETINGRIYDFRCEPRDTAGFVLVVEDVTVARLASRQIEQMARFDGLTGLPNRMNFYSALESRLNNRSTDDSPVALLSIDLDKFKEVNDTRGHPTGDKLLKIVAGRLRQTVKETDIVSRLGGDEFHVLLQDDAFDAKNVEVVAQRLIDTLSAPYCIDGVTVTIGASIGIAYTSDSISAPDELLRCSDLALYEAKATGRGGFRVYVKDLDIALKRKLEIERDLREAITNDLLELHYQPVVDTKTGRIKVCEALVRMRHPTKGVIPPDEFISIAEETGLIVDLGEWVLRRACRDAAAWPKDVTVAVNFSAKHFVLSQNLAQDISDVIAQAGLEPSRLEVEITESTIIEAKDALVQLNAIAASGVKIALDDFGTGYSSLSYLRQFPVHKIKIDRSFAKSIRSRESQAVIGCVSVLANLLCVDLVMEGIETADELNALKPWNVHLVQGYFFSKPLTLQGLLVLLDQAAPFSNTPIRSVA